MIKITDLTFTYTGAESPQLQRLNLSFAAGELVLVTGPTGSGKSTLLKALNGLAPHFTGGNLRGRFEIDGVDYTGALPHQLAEVIGYVNQQPESWFVADTVEDELAYGLEQLGFSTEDMSAAIARIAKTLNLEDLLAKPLGHLSGGQQQRVAIGSALAAGQKILLLDEPTSALDLESTNATIALLRDLATNHGVTVLLAEHRFESILDSVDSIVVINGDGTASKGSTPWQPTRDDLRDQAEASTSSQPGAVLLSVEDLSVKFGDQIAVDRANLSVKSGEILALRGPNGSGKSSLLWAIQGSGTREKTSSVRLTDIGDPKKTSPNQRLHSITMVPQRAADLLFLTSLGLELEESDRFANAAATTTGNIIARLAGKVNPGLHPRDLSSGQQLALVLAMQLAKDAPVILLDEPTRGLDYLAKRNLANHLKTLAANGKAVLLATHDDEFIRQTATRVIEIEAGVLL